MVPTDIHGEVDSSASHEEAADCLIPCLVIRIRGRGTPYRHLVEKELPVVDSYEIPKSAKGIRPLLIDAKAPRLVLSTADGAAFDVNAAIGEKPTVLVFFRGGWCGFCKKQLLEIKRNYASLEELGYQVIAISPDSPSNTRETAGRYKLPFTLLSDSKMEASMAFGIAWRVSDRDDDYYQKLRTASGESHRLLPSPAYFIFGKDGVVKHAYVNPNYKVRPPFSLMLAGVEAVSEMEEMGWEPL